MINRFSFDEPRRDGLDLLKHASSLKIHLYRADDGGVVLHFDLSGGWPMDLDDDAIPAAEGVKLAHGLLAAFEREGGAT